MNKIQTKITDYYKKSDEIVSGYNEKTDNWHCLECKINMGKNPSQLCKDCLRFLTYRQF